ncbi:MAG: DUF4150 domain-containing protein [Myxococcales bacterium]|nr:DUF4150 domain-containing protein [Myxococcales bacterium]
MFPASTRMGGMCFAFPDVCEVPAPPSPNIPTPFPNTAQCPMALATTCTQTVKIMNQPVLHRGSEILRSNGDEAGVAGGVVSRVFGDKTVYALGAVTVLVEGQPIVSMLKPTLQNGVTPNAPGGAQLVPSQVKVLVP